MNYQLFGKRVRRRRAELGWTQERLAKEMSVCTSFIGHIERGSRKVSVDTLVTLCGALDISADELLGISAQRPSGERGRQDINPERRIALRELLVDLQKQLDTWDKDY